MSDKKKYPFPQGKHHDRSFEILNVWWTQLEDDRGERAYLRRADTLTRVMLSPAYVDLLTRLRSEDYGIGSSNQHLSKIAAIAGLTARIKSQPDEMTHLGKRLGTPTPGNTAAPVSGLRLRRILACDDIEELYTLLRRALSILDDRASVPDLAATLWSWSPLDANRARDPRRQLAYEYYASVPAKS